MSLKRLGPIALTTTLTTNILQGAQGSALLVSEIRHIHVCNKTNTGVPFSIWLGASGGNVAGTEMFNSKAVPANDVYEWYGRTKLASTEYLVGGAGTGTALSIMIEYEDFAV